MLTFHWEANMNSENIKKTVYILGAGFSVDAKAPSQENILMKCFEKNNENANSFKPKTIKKLKEFLKSNFLLDDDSKMGKMSLEDIFTPLDRSISEKSTFRGLDANAINSEIENIQYIIGKTISLCIDNNECEYIKKFAKYLIGKSKLRSNENYSNCDPVAVISTNWDIILDNAIYRQLQIIRNENIKASIGVVDYCCHVSSFYKDDTSVKPGLRVLGECGFIVKLIKLHGSLNWLQCNRCMRLYVAFGEKIAINEKRNDCRHCKKNFNKKNSLIPNAIMPTFVKDLSNPQYKLIWQNAGIEISEANKIVFIGYSLPYADFEMRQLLTRMMRDDVEIEVVTKPSSENDPELEALKKKYNSFFGSRNVCFYPIGAKAYIDSLTNI